MDLITKTNKILIDLGDLFMGQSIKSDFTINSLKTDLSGIMI